MTAKAIGQKENMSKRVFLIVVTLFVLVMPIGVFAQGKDCIETLRKTSKAFSCIAKKASPAVVGIKAEKKSRKSTSPYSQNNIISGGCWYQGREEVA